MLYEFPGLMTLFGLGDNTLLDFHSDRLSDLSPEAERRRIDLLRRINLQLNTYDREALEGIVLLLQLAQLTLLLLAKLYIR